jgi:peroxiredoxin
LAPRLVLKTIDGQTIDLGRVYGKQAVYLKFWATWCTPCRQQMPHFERTFETAGPDLAVIAIDIGPAGDSIQAVQSYRHQLGIKMPIVFDDGQVAAAFNLRVTPQHIVIGRDGRIQYVGHLADARLDTALVAARTSPAPGAPGAAARAKTPRALPHYSVGDLLPPLSPRTVDGTSFRLRDPTDTRYTVLVFLSPSCESYLESTNPTAAASCRHVRERVDALASERGARWLGIAQGIWITPQDVRQYRDAYHVGIPLSLDEYGALFRAFAVTSVPSALVADGNGRIVRRIEASEISGSDALHDAVSVR